MTPSQQAAIDRLTCKAQQGEDGIWEAVDADGCVAVHPADLRALLSLCTAPALAEVTGTPPADVLAAADEVLRLAGEASPAPLRVVSTRSWTTIVRDGADGVEEIAGGELTPKDAAFFAACRTLAPLLAEFVKGGNRG